MGPQATHEVNVARAAHCRYMGSHGYGNLYGMAANTARGTVDQHTVTSVQSAVVAKTLQRRNACAGKRCGSLERDVSWFFAEHVNRYGNVFGKGTHPDERGIAEDFVADGIPLDVGPYGFDYTGTIAANDVVFGSEKSKRQTYHTWYATDEVPVSGIHRRSTNANKDLSCRYGWDGTFREAQNIKRSAICRVYNCFHAIEDFFGTCSPTVGAVYARITEGLHAYISA
jgi:hypothetical protein